MNYKIKFTENLNKCGEFFTLPISLIKKQKVHFLDNYSTSIQKISMIALSSLCFVLSIGLTYFIGKHLQQIKGPYQPQIIKQPAIIKPKAIKLNVDTLPIWKNIIQKYKSSEITQEKIQKELSLNKLIYQVDDLQTLLCHYVKNGDSSSILTILKIEETLSAPHLSLDQKDKNIKHRFCTKFLEGELSTIFSICKLTDEKATLLNQVKKANCILTLIENLKFTDKELKNIFLNACCSSIYVPLINSMISLKGELFFKDVYPEALVKLSYACNARVGIKEGTKFVDSSLVSQEMLIIGPLYLRIGRLLAKTTDNQFPAKQAFANNTIGQ